MIDIVGHFGSRLSYATVSHQIVEGLLARDLLGSITNLDDRFLDDKLVGRQRERGKKVLLIADPRDYLTEAMVAEYGRENVALFVCPNTTSLSAERVRSCLMVDCIYTPSSWCRLTIAKALGEKVPYIEVLPLGVDAPFTEAGNWIEPNIDGRLDEHIRMLHVTTDTFWPGRKGTEELLRAWRDTCERHEMRRLATLTVHCLPQLYATIHQELGDMELVDKVKLVAAPLRGTEPQELFNLFANHDLLVAPSRSEGFGIMPLSALAGGLPVLTTGGTGQDEYLGAVDDHGEPAFGGWMQIPTLGVETLAGEDGVAPLVRDDQLALSLIAGCRLYDELEASRKRNLKARVEWSWSLRRHVWAQALNEWWEES